MESGPIDPAMLSREAVRNQSEERTDRMGILGWIILGLVAGTIARVLHRGEEPSGVLATMFVGGSRPGR